MENRILVIGSVNMDISLRVPSLPRTGETVAAKSLTYTPGGKGANQAYAVSRLGGNGCFLACVGGDTFGHIQMENLQKAGMDVSHMKVVSEKPTGTAVIYVDDAGNNSIVIAAGANAACDVAYLKENDSAFQDASMVLLQMEIPKEAVYYAVRRAKALGKSVILNPAPAPDSLPEDLWGLIDYITPNETELQKLSGRPVQTDREMLEAARSLLAHGVKNVLVTIGSRGALLVNSDGAGIYPPPKVKAIDTTAAGDTMNAAFLVALSEGRTPGDAICFGNAASSLSVTRSGAQQSIPSREETDRFYQAYTCDVIRLS